MDQGRTDSPSELSLVLLRAGIVAADQNNLLPHTRLQLTWIKVVCPKRRNLLRDGKREKVRARLGKAEAIAAWGEVEMRDAEFRDAPGGRELELAQE
jgi:hypothetical protein